MEQVTFTSRADAQSKGRNGWYWPFAAIVRHLQVLPNTSYVAVSVEGSRSITGKGEAPIELRLSVADARELAQAILRETTGTKD